MKSGAERSIEAVTWASVVIWLGFALLAHLLAYPWLVVMLLSIILLSSAIYQRSQGWHTSLGIWVFGIWMAVFSVIETVSAMIAALTGTGGLNIDIWVYLGVALVSMGVATIFRMVQLGGGQNPDLRPDARAVASDPNTYIAPRRIEEASSGAYTPPINARVRSGRSQAAYDDQTQVTGYDQGYDPAVTSRQRRTAQTGRQASYGSAARTQINAQDDGYDPAATSRQRRTAQTGRQSGYSAPSRAPQRAPQQDDYADQQPDPYQDQDRYAQTPPAPRANDRRRVSPQRARPAQPAPSSDLESRVEDIIRRSRELRSTPPDAPDDLPY